MTTPAPGRTGQTVVVIGAGNIGSRLLQSLARTDPETLGAPLDVVAIEPAHGARDVARVRFEQALGGRGHRLSFAAHAGELPQRIALLVVATDSRNRLAALQAGLSATQPGRILLEKFLFTHRSEYQDAAATIDASGAEAFVNCSRNVWPGYAAVKAQLDDAPVFISVRGGEWGLACNGVHFFALLEHLSGRMVTDVDPSGLDPEPIASKRPGYRELTGVISGTTSQGDHIEATSLRGDASPIQIVIRQGAREFHISEAEGAITTLRSGRPGNAAVFEGGLASRLEDTMEALISGAPTALPAYDQSAALHQRLAAAMNRIFHGVEGFDQQCPVT